jgi:hypothetical protein
MNSYDAVYSLSQQWDEILKTSPSKINGDQEEFKKNLDKIKRLLHEEYYYGTSWLDAFRLKKYLSKCKNMLDKEI